MTDPPLTNMETPSPPAIPGALPEQRFFRSPALPFVFVRVCLYLLAGYAITHALYWGAQFLLGRGLSSYNPQVLMTGEVINLVGVFSAAWLMSRLERRDFGSYGLPLRGAFGKLFWQGALFGLTEVSAVIGSMAALGFYHFGAVVVHGNEFLRWAIFWSAFFLVVGFYEEFAFRGYVQFTLAQGMRFWPAAILLSILFGLVHTGSGNYGETWVGIAGIVLTGLFWSFTLRRTGNLWFAVGMHAAFDFGETFLYSVPDSGVMFPGHLSSATLAGPTWLTGGTAGPEASVFDFLILLLFFYVVHRLYPPIAESKSPPHG